MAIFIRKIFPLFLLTLFASATFPPEESARICYLMHQQKCQEAFTRYLSLAKTNQEHDFSLLQRAALAMLKEGAKKDDSEIKLMSLLAASICKEPSLHFVHEQALASPDIQLQLASLSVLSQMDDEEADQLLFSALGSPFLLVRLEALFHLTKRGQIDIFDKLQSLYAKCPDIARPLFAQIVSLIDTKPANRFLKQQLLDPDIVVRLAALQEVSKKKLDQFLPQVKRLAGQTHLLQQEAALITLMQLGDQESIPIFEAAQASPHAEIALAGLVGLRSLGNKEALTTIIDRAESGDLFAIAALGRLKEQGAKEPLFRLAKEHADVDVRFNAAVSLLALSDSRVFPLIEPFLFRSAHDFGIHILHSPGHAFQAYQIVPSAGQNEKRYPALAQMTQGCKQTILVQLLEINEEKFISLAKTILMRAEKELIPLTVQLIENIHNSEITEFLEHESLFSPFPFVRGYSSLALYRLNPTGDHSKKLLDWVKQQKEYPLIQLKEQEGKELSSYNLTYEETSQLFLEALEAIAMQKSFESIETLIHLMAYGHEKNRYALAGLLIKTAE